MENDKTHTQKRRILVVDDNADATQSLAMLMEVYGNEVRTAHDGHEALAVASSFRPDIILLDIGLQDLDGYEVARRIRLEVWGQSMYLVALTGWGRDEDKRLAREAGFNRHLLKPVDPATLQLILDAGSGSVPPL